MKAGDKLYTSAYYYIVKVIRIDDDYDKEIPEEYLEDFNDWLEYKCLYNLPYLNIIEEYTNDDCSYSCLVEFKYEIVRDNKD